jgi:hypothetical protein
VIAATLLGLALVGGAGDTDPEGITRIAISQTADLIVIDTHLYREQGFDAQSGDVIVERYYGSDGLEEAKFQADCDDKGGVLSWSLMFDEHGEFVCSNEDF